VALFWYFYDSQLALKVFRMNTSVDIGRKVVRKEDVTSVQPLSDFVQKAKNTLFLEKKFS